MSVNIFIIALLSGLIFNVMPCVLPVLSIKINGILQAREHGEKKLVRLRFIFTSLGIICTFLALGLFLILVQKLIGVENWGGQFQLPIFSAIMIIIITLMIANILDLWHLPALSFSQKKYQYTTLAAEEFASGVMATLLSTPCATPILAPVLAFAFSGGIQTMATATLAMGFGMALPWIIGAIFPNFINIIPKPGKWMLWVKRLMALFLFLTLLWLIWLFSSQTSNDMMFPLLLGSCLTIIAILYWGKGAIRWILVWGIVAMILNFGVILTGNVAKHSQAQNVNIIDDTTSVYETDISNVKQLAIPFDEEVFKNRKSPAFVYATAKWCVTCLVVEKTVFADKELIEYFLQNNIIILEHEMTNFNESANAWLKEIGVQAIPAYTGYSSSGREVHIMSTLPKVEEIIGYFDSLSN